MKFFKVKNTS